MTKVFSTAGVFARICILLVVAISSSSSASDSPIYVVSMVELISDPQDYVGHRIEVFGFLEGGIDLRVYLTRDHANLFDDSSSILVSDIREGGLLESSCSSSYVRITATLTDFGDNVLGLANIEKIYQPSTKTFCWSQE